MALVAREKSWQSFLQWKRDAGTPAWKRAKIIHGLMVYRRFIAERPADDLLPLKEKMAEIVVLERSRDEGHESITEIEGVINPRESNAIQEFRRKMRRAGLKPKTERAYERYIEFNGEEAGSEHPGQTSGG